MENHTARRVLSSRTLENYRHFSRQRRIKPRVRSAIKLYVTGAAKTQREAAEIVGVNPSTISKTLRHTPVGKQLEQTLNGEIQRRAVELSVVIAKLSEKALNRIGGLMDSGNEKVRLDAAKDILDRNPLTSKTHKISVDSLTLTGRDVKDLIQAMTSGRNLEEQFPSAASGDFTPALEGEVIR